MIEFTLRRTSTASIETVFDVMTDHRAIADYMWEIRRSTLDREGTPAPNGEGAIRRLVSWGTTFLEEIVEYERPVRWAYSLRSGAPIRNHLGTIDLRKVGRGTEITWHVRATSKIPGVAWLMVPVSAKLIGGLLDGAISVAEHPA